MGNNTTQPLQPSAEVIRLARAGQQIAAIKLYRQESGLGLKEAKRVLQALRADDHPGGHSGDAKQAKAATRKRLNMAFLPATVFGLLGLIMAGKDIAATVQAGPWTPTQGVITETDLRGQRIQSMALEYQYQVGEQTYRGNRISYTAEWGTQYKAKARAQFPKGTPVDVFYDLNDPSQAVLETQVAIPCALVFLTSLAAFIWGALAWGNNIRNERRLRSGLNSR